MPKLEEKVAEVFVKYKSGNNKTQVVCKHVFFVFFLLLTTVLNCFDQ